MINKIEKMSFEAIILADRKIHNMTESDVSNGVRFRRIIGKVKELILSISRNRFKHFYLHLLQKGTRHRSKRLI